MSLALRVARLLRRPGGRTGDLVRASYDRIAPGYDQAWTAHMRDLSLDMLDRLCVRPGQTALDLTCGTGFVTAELARRTGQLAVGVDASPGMIAVARATHGQACTFIHGDALAYLRTCPHHSFDVVTCAWGLGYCRPAAVLREIVRVLRPGGRAGVIDNSLFSLAGVLWSAAKTFAERPEQLAHVMRVRFLPHSMALATLLRWAGLRVTDRWDGQRTYHVPDGQAAIARLTATGAAAGFEFATAGEHHDAIFRRFAEIIEQTRGGDGVPITHRYLAAIGQRGTNVEC